MATADSPKTLLLLCSAQVFQTHTNRLPGNTWITFQLLPTINYWMSLHEYSKKRPEEKLRLSDKARPSTSSWQWRTSGKSVPSVVKPTTQYKTTGLGGKIWIKRARDNKSPKKSLNSSGKKRMDKKGKGKEKEKAPASANVLSVLELADLSIQTAQSIDFSCYSTSDKLEWFLDSGMHRPYHTKKKHFCPVYRTMTSIKGWNHRWKIPHYWRLWNSYWTQHNAKLNGLFADAKSAIHSTGK